MSRFEFSQATDQDDHALRLRMKEDVLSGTISTTFRREPSYFYGTAVQGGSGIVIKCTDTHSQQVVALGARTTLQAYINGQPAELGYLCDLRGTPAVRAGTLLARGFRHLKKIHQANPINLYYTMILSDNKTAMSSLTGHRAGLPHYRDKGRCFTPTIHLDRKRHHYFDTSLSIVTANDVPLDSLVEFINQQYRRFQFAPVLTTTDLQSARFRGLLLDDILVATKGNQIVGCIACWDQRSFKQIHVEQYNGALRFVRPLYNFAAKFSPLKPLPRTGDRLEFFYLALIAINNDNPAIFRDLLEKIYQIKRKSKWHFFIAGLHEQHPLTAELHRFRHIPLYGNLYIAHWEDGTAAFEQVDDRTPHIEIAAL